jgi:hypothetical protein
MPAKPPSFENSEDSWQKKAVIKRGLKDRKLRHGWIADEYSVSGVQSLFQANTFIASHLCATAFSVP